jgi:hypothetical protein
VGFEVRTGPSTYIPQVKMANGSPAAKIVVFRHWPTAVSFPPGIDPDYFPNGVGGQTDANGVIGFGYESESVTGPDGGNDYIWVSSDPPSGTRFGSDMASKLGWIGGTVHLTANPIFRDTLKGVPPPSGDSRLIVYDKQGLKVGSLPLLTGEGGGGRIALVVDGQELSSAKLE